LQDLDVTKSVDVFVCGMGRRDGTASFKSTTSEVAGHMHPAKEPLIELQAILMLNLNAVSQVLSCQLRIGVDWAFADQIGIISVLLNFNLEVTHCLWHLLSASV